MSVFDDFLAAHRAQPWPGRIDLVSGEAAAGPLYEAYVAACKAAGEPAYSLNDFSPAVVAAGYERKKTAGGHVYLGLTVETREERADEGVRRILWDDAWWPAYAKAQRDHEERMHPDRALCHHSMPPERIAELKVEVAATLDGLEADGTRARVKDETYGLFLRWREGDPNPRLIVRRAKLLAEADTLRTRIVAAEAATREPAVQPYYGLSSVNPHAVLSQLERDLHFVVVEVEDIDRTLAGESAEPVEVGAQPVVVGDQQSSVW